MAKLRKILEFPQLLQQFLSRDTLWAVQVEFKSSFILKVFKCLKREPLFLISLLPSDFSPL